MLRMRMRLLLWPLLLTILCSCAGGASFRKQVEVPENEIAALASQIEDVVLDTRLDEPKASDYLVDREIGEVRGDLEPMSALLNMEETRQRIPALAALNVDTEIVLTAIRSRILRRSAVYEFEQKGCIGENRRGLLQVTKSDRCAGDRDVKNRMATIVLREKRDRNIIWEHVLKANGLGNSALGRMREIFAEQIYEKAWAGTPLQMPDGTWETK